VIPATTRRDRLDLRAARSRRARRTCARGTENRAKIAPRDPAQPSAARREARRHGCYAGKWGLLGLSSAYPDAPLWPRGADDAFAAFETAALVDVALNTFVDLGSRYFDLRDSPRWNDVRGELVSRAQRALDALAGKAHGPTVAACGWCAADIWLFTAVAWLERLPARASSNQNVANIMTLGWTLPRALSAWADAHRQRDDVRALE
jgi:hypothetical protein